MTAATDSSRVALIARPVSRAQTGHGHRVHPASGHLGSSPQRVARRRLADARHARPDGGSPAECLDHQPALAEVEVVPHRFLAGLDRGRRVLGEVVGDVLAQLFPQGERAELLASDALQAIDVAHQRDQRARLRPARHDGAPEEPDRAAVPGSLDLVHDLGAQLGQAERRPRGRQPVVHPLQGRRA
jgi:hypothetical protein